VDSDNSTGDFKLPLVGEGDRPRRTLDRLEHSEGLPVPVPSIVKPRGNIGTNLPLFTWNGVPEYVSYDLWVDNLTTAAKQVLRVTDAKPYSFQTVLPFENGTVPSLDPRFRQGQQRVSVEQSGGLHDLRWSLAWPHPRPNSIFRRASELLLAGRVECCDLRAAGEGHDVRLRSRPVINVRFISGTSYAATTNLIQGRSYRWWVRGLMWMVMGCRGASR
jgi:hypothetical protein